MAKKRSGNDYEPPWGQGPYDAATYAGGGTVNRRRYPTPPWIANSPRRAGPSESKELKALDRSRSPKGAAVGGRQYDPVTFAKGGTVGGRDYFDDARNGGGRGTSSSGRGRSRSFNIQSAARKRLARRG
jgi:hypothetical protein